MEASDTARWYLDANGGQSSPPDPLRGNVLDVLRVYAMPMNARKTRLARPDPEYAKHTAIASPGFAALPTRPVHGPGRCACLCHTRGRLVRVACLSA